MLISSDDADDGDEDKNGASFRESLLFVKSQALWELAFSESGSSMMVVRSLVEAAEDIVAESIKVLLLTSPRLVGGEVVEAVPFGERVFEGWDPDDDVGRDANEAAVMARGEINASVLLEVVALSKFVILLRRFFFVASSLVSISNICLLIFPAALNFSI